MMSLASCAIWLSFFCTGDGRLNIAIDKNGKGRQDASDFDFKKMNDGKKINFKTSREKYGKKKEVQEYE